MTHKLLKLTLVAVLIVFLCNGHTASQLATQSEHIKNADNLIEQIKTGDVQAIERLLATGIDVNHKNTNGETAYVL